MTSCKQIVFALLSSSGILQLVWGKRPSIGAIHKDMADVQTHEGGSPNSDKWGTKREGGGGKCMNYNFAERSLWMDPGGNSRVWSAIGKNMHKWKKFKIVNAIEGRFISIA